MIFLASFQTGPICAIKVKKILYGGEMHDIPNVLVVDDDPGVCKYLKNLLSQKRYKVVASGGLRP